MEAAMDKENCTTREATAQEAGLTDHMQAPQGAGSRQQSWKRENLSVSFFVKKDAIQDKSTKCLYTGRHAHRRISEQQGRGASAYSRTTLYAQATPLVRVAFHVTKKTESAYMRISE